MIVLGASHQLVPVLIESGLYSNALAYLTFIFAALGIPLLVYGFFTFNMSWPAQYGAILVNLAVFVYVMNLMASMAKSKNENIHALFVFTATLWLFLTTLVGMLLVYNFSFNMLPNDSSYYLSLHAHLGIVGWFLLLIMGVGSRLIPMFLISKYNNTGLLKLLFGLVNGSLLLFLFVFLYFSNPVLYCIPLLMLLAAIGLFGYYCYACYQARIRKQVDEQMKLTLLSILMLLLPFVALLCVVVFCALNPGNARMLMLYGFVVFFGWLSAIILGMTFKTLPFIVWNKVYSKQAGQTKTPNPKDLFSSRVFKLMAIAYLSGFFLFIAGFVTSQPFLVKTAVLFLLFSAILYNWNVFKLLFHQTKKP